MVANLGSLYGLSHTVSARQSTPFGPARARLTNESSLGACFSHFVKTRVTRPWKTRSEKHPNLQKWEFSSAAAEDFAFDICSFFFFVGDLLFLFKDRSPHSL